MSEHISRPTYTQDLARTIPSEPNAHKRAGGGIGTLFRRTFGKAENVLQIDKAWGEVKLVTWGLGS